VAPISLDSWILHPQQGGGVALAEGGHFIDTLTFLVGCLPVLVSASPVDRTSYQATIRFEDGSVGTIMYTTGALGHGPKERITVAGRGVFAGLDDYRSLSVWSGRRKRKYRAAWQDKGHSAALRAWVQALEAGSPAPVPIVEVVAVTEATICLDQALRQESPVPVDLDPYLQELGARG